MGQLGDALRGPLRRRIEAVSLQRDIVAKLSLVAEADLRRCLAEGITAVATLLRVEPEIVILRLRGDELNTAATDVGMAHMNAIQVLNENQSGWANALQGLAGFGLDALLASNLGLGGLGLGEALSSFAGDRMRETRSGEAIAQLATKLNAFEALVEQSAAQLDADPELAAALAKKNDVGWGCLLFFLLGCAAVLGALGYLGWRGWKWAFHANTPSPSVSVATSASPAMSSPRPSSPLVGDWTTGAGHALRAIEVGDAIEFDITRLGSWSAQGYVEGELRFRLRRLGDAQDVFTVEDKTRPAVPKGTRFAPEAAESCHVIRASVENTPLRARLSGDRLVVESVRSTLPPSALRLRAGTIVDCAMERASEAKVEIVLTRLQPNVDNPTPTASEPRVAP